MYAQLSLHATLSYLLQPPLTFVIRPLPSPRSISVQHVQPPRICPFRCLASGGRVAVEARLCLQGLYVRSVLLLQQVQQLLRLGTHLWCPLDGRCSAGRACGGSCAPVAAETPIGGYPSACRASMSRCRVKVVRRRWGRQKLIHHHAIGCPTGRRVNVWRSGARWSGLRSLLSLLGLPHQRVHGVGSCGVGRRHAGRRLRNTVR